MAVTAAGTIESLVNTVDAVLRECELIRRAVIGDFVGPQRVKNPGTTADGSGGERP